MADEREILGLAVDPAGRSVYGDWLEQRGEHGRAQMVRAIDALERVGLDDPAAVSTARSVLAGCPGLDPRWIATLSPRSLTGTCWGLRDPAGDPYLIAFDSDGTMRFRRRDDRTSGAWGQAGRAVWFTINHYAMHEGIAVGARMRGDAANPLRMTWTWDAVELAAAAIDSEVPDLEHAPCDSPYITHPTLPGTAPRAWPYSPFAPLNG